MTELYTRAVRLRQVRRWAALARYRAIMEACQEGVLCLDLGSRIVACNRSAERILGVRAAGLFGVASVDQRLFAAVDEEGRQMPPESHPSQRVLATGRPCLEVVQGIRGRNGDLTWIQVNAQPLAAAPGGALEGVVVSFADITRARVMEARLREEAYRDVLTGAYNRRYLQEVLLRALKAAERFGHAMSLCVCDLDHFKAINDTYGHASGDRAIQAFSEALHWGLRKDDLAARLGGDEFCLVFPHVGARNARAFLERVRVQVGELAVPAEDGRAMSLRASFGIADYRRGDSTELLLERADQALYRAKAEGRNRVCVMDGEGAG